MRHQLLPFLAGEATGACGALGSKAPRLRPHSTLTTMHTGCQWIMHTAKPAMALNVQCLPAPQLYNARQLH